jgi:hypothetical protein
VRPASGCWYWTYLCWLVSELRLWPVKPNASDEQLLSRLVRFAETERLTGLLKHRRLLRDVLSRGEVHILNDAPRELRTWPAESIRILRLDLLRLLRALVTVTQSHAATPLRLTVSSLKFEPIAAGHKVALAVDGSTRDVLWFQVIDLLRTVGTDRVRQCPACERLFIKRGRREYCSDKCQARLYMRGRRQRGQDTGRRSSAPTRVHRAGRDHLP